jgi:DNA-binding NarL/FixJ family response regulator
VRIWIVGDHEVVVLGVLPLQAGPGDRRAVVRSDTVTEVLAGWRRYDAVVLDQRVTDEAGALLEALRHVARGDAVAALDPGRTADPEPERDAAPRLTSREVEVLALYGSGEKADRVARLLGISRDTVLDHVRRIRQKYAAADRPAHTKVDLYRRAVEDGVLHEPA